MNKLGNLIKLKRSDEGLSLKEFAEIADLSHSYIKDLEDATPGSEKAISPSIKSLEKISNALSIPLDILLKEVGYIGTNRSFEPSNLKLIRGGFSYSDICSSIAEKTGNKIDPSIYEAVEIGANTNPSALFIDTIAKYSGVDRSFFYRTNTIEDLEYAKTALPYHKQPSKETKATTYFLGEPDLSDFILDPASEEYLRLAMELRDRNVKAKLVRKLLSLDKVL